MGYKQQIKQQINSLIEKLGDDKLLIDSVEKVVEDCGRYIKAVHDTEVAYTVARFKMEPDEYREYYANLDRNRKIVHDALIAGVRLLNRICQLCGQEPIYNGPEDRVSIAEFAKEIVDEYFEERRR